MTKTKTRRAAYNALLKSYPDSDKINAVSTGAEMLYTRLLAQSDDAGRYYGDPQFILCRLFTARMAAGQVKVGDVSKWLLELEAVGLVRRYTVAGVAYLELIDVYKSTRADVKPQVYFPEPLPESVTDPVRTRNGHVTDAHGYGPLEQAKEQAKEQEQNNPLSAGADGAVVEFQIVVDSWNATPEVPQVIKLSTKRRKALKQRLADPAWDWRGALAKFPLRCFVGTDWKPHFDWFTKPDTVLAILEGKYDFTPRGSPAERTLSAGQKFNPQKTVNW